MNVCKYKFISVARDDTFMQIQQTKNVIYVKCARTATSLFNTAAK